MDKPHTVIDGKRFIGPGEKPPGPIQVLGRPQLIEPVPLKAVVVGRNMCTRGGLWAARLARGPSRLRKIRNRLGKSLFNQGSTAMTDGMVMVVLTLDHM